MRAEEVAGQAAMTRQEAMRAMPKARMERSLIDELNDLHNCVMEQLSMTASIYPENAARTDYEIRVLIKAHQDFMDRVQVINLQSRLREIEESRADAEERIRHYETNIAHREKNFGMEQSQREIPFENSISRMARVTEGR